MLSVPNKVRVFQDSLKNLTELIWRLLIMELIVSFLWGWSSEMDSGQLKRSEVQVNLFQKHLFL